MKTKRILISIAGISVQIECDKDIETNISFAPFSLGDDSYYDASDWKLNFREISDLDFCRGTEVHRTAEYAAFCDSNGGVTLVYYDVKNQGKPYAISVLDEKKCCTNIYFLPTAREYFSETGNCFFHSRWEKILSIYHRFVFHSACIKTESGGILFSGPSGIGKSTQADLWIEQEQAELINGDRTILYAEEDTWKAAGSPYAGSSKCYKNEKVGIAAIVMLKQSEECTIRRLSMAESFHKIYQQSTVYSWDEAFVNEVCDLIEQLCANIPVYEYSCNMKPEAVEILKNELRGNQM